MAIPACGHTAFRFFIGSCPETARSTPMYPSSVVASSKLGLRSWASSRSFTTVVVLFSNTDCGSCKSLQSCHGTNIRTSSEKMRYCKCTPPLVPTLLSLANARVLHKNTEDVPGNASIVRLVGLRSPSQSPAPERHGMLWHGY